MLRLPSIRLRRTPTVRAGRNGGTLTIGDNIERPFMVNVSKGRTPAYWKEYQRKYRLENAVRIKSQQAEHQRKKMPEILMNRKKLSETDRAYVLSHSGACDICGGTPTGRTKRLSIDHNHATGVFRGMLCGKCNTGLGMFKDDITLLEKAAQYLSRKTLPGECQ